MRFFRMRPTAPIEKLFLSAGAAKAGTTWLYEILSCHPKILGTPIKEIHYFARDFVHWDVLGRYERLTRMQEHLGWIINDQNHAHLDHDMRWFADFLMDIEGPQWLANLFKNRKDSVYCAEFSNLTSLIRGNGWERIAEVSNHVRVLYTIRNPLYRYWSHIKFHYGIFHRDTDFRQLTTTDFRDIILGQDFWNHGNYSAFIEEAQKNLDPDEFLVMRFEDFREEPLGSLRKVEDFLGISHFDYQQGMLTSIVNQGPQSNIPKNLIEAAKPFIETELNFLDHLGISIPQSYWQSIEKLE